MTDSDIMQDFFDTFVVMNKLNSVVNVNDFLAGRLGLLEYGPQADADPRHVLSCIKRIDAGIGVRLMQSFVTLEHCAPGEGLDNVWAHWCPCPKGVDLHKADCPAGTIPLWSNGKDTVFCRVSPDKGNSYQIDYGIHTA